MCGDVCSARAARYSCAAMPRLARCGHNARATERRMARRSAGEAPAAVPRARHAAAIGPHLRPWRAKTPRRRAAGQSPCLPSPGGGASWAAGVPAPAPARRLGEHQLSARRARRATQGSRPCCRDDDDGGDERSRAQDGERSADARWSEALWLVVPLGGCAPLAPLLFARAPRAVTQDAAQEEGRGG